MLESVLTPWRIKLYSHATLVALALALVVILVNGKGSETFTGRVGGDYPAFYVAGELIADGESQSLYSLPEQARRQKDLIGKEVGVIVFAYPPQFAAFYAPLSELPYRISYAVHTLMLVAALAFACILIHRIYPALITSPYTLFILALTAYPIIRSIQGSQNTVFTLLLIVVCWYKVLQNKQYQAGVFLGLLLFKPQFAIPLIGLFFLSGRWRVWVSAAATALAIYAFNSAIMGPQWLIDWFEAALFLPELDRQINFSDVIAWQGVAHAVFGHDNLFATGLGLGLTAATILLVSWVWFTGGQKADFNAQMALASISIVLISPHTLYYDAGIGLISLVVLMHRFGRIDLNRIVLIWAVWCLQLLSHTVGLALSIIPVVVVFALVTYYLWPQFTQPKEAEAALAS